MDLQRLAVYYPNGQPLMEIGPITGCTVSDIIQLAAAGMNDMIAKMPELTEHAEKLFTAYQKAKEAGIKTTEIVPPNIPRT
jgi:hypothetical protein